MDNIEKGKEILKDVCDSIKGVDGITSEFYNAVKPIIEAHHENKDLEAGECHIAIDYLYEHEGAGVAVCGNISTMDKFLIIDALMEALKLTDHDRVKYLKANTIELLERLNSKKSDE